MTYFSWLASTAQPVVKIFVLVSSAFDKNALLEPEHFEEQIIVNRLHTFSHINVLAYILVMPSHKDIRERASEWAKEFSPTTRARTASLPEKTTPSSKTGR